ncbi:MAG: hypothetical protein ACE145_18905 [Terriglobia bacterium]
MPAALKRREFLQITAAGTIIGLEAPSAPLLAAHPGPTKLISPGCRRSKVKVARLYMGTAEGLWPKPNLDLKAEAQSYRNEFAKLKDQVADVDFVVDELVTSPTQIEALKSKLASADGILAIQLNIGVRPILDEILRAGQPTVVFAIPYSGHEWAGYGALQREPLGARMECLLTSDTSKLAEAIRPFRAIHHLREAKVLDLTTRPIDEYAREVRNKFGSEIKTIDRERVLKAYDQVSDADARAEAERWISAATKIVEPTKDDIFKSAKLALAFERILEEEDATVLTVDCYGSMWDRTIKLPAYPCLGFTRLNNLGLGGICESDLPSAMTHILFQGLAGKPGFISDPTMDEAKNSIILAHCLGTTHMDGPAGNAAPYKLRTVRERGEGVVPQVRMRVGERVTQAQFVGTDSILYFTGEIVDTPDVDRGCRTQITVKLDGDAEKLWKNWSHGLHRVTCYGDITKPLTQFGRFKDVKLVNEAV